jgi:DNA-binding protein
MKPSVLEFIRTISTSATDQDMAVKTTKEAFNKGAKMTRAVSVLNLFRKLINKRVGTNEVEAAAERLRKTGRRIGVTRNPKLVCKLMEIKAADAEEDVKTAKAALRRSKLKV